MRQGKNALKGFGKMRYTLNGRENSIDVPQFISSKFAVRGAMGDIAMGHLIQSLEDDLLRWAGEAYEKLTKNTKASTIYKPFSEIAYTQNNRVKLCAGFKSLQCLKLNGAKIPFLYEKERCTSSCDNPSGSSCGRGCGSGTYSTGASQNPNQCHHFYLDGNWIKFSPEAQDGMKVEIEGWQDARDEDGYPLIIDMTTTAIQKYISWKACHRLGDNRARDFEKWWYDDCRQARSWINKKTDAELRMISAWWQPQGFFVGRQAYRGFGNSW